MIQYFHSHSYDLKGICVQYLHHYVRVKMEDGKEYEGLIEHVDGDHLYLLLPERSEGLMMGQDQGLGTLEERQFYPGYGYPYPFYPGYRRFILPLAALTALALLPYSFYW